MLDEFIRELVLGAPNLAVAIAALVWCARRINVCLDDQRDAMKALLELLDANDRLAAELRAMGVKNASGRAATALPDDTAGSEQR